MTIDQVDPPDVNVVTVDTGIGPSRGVCYGCAWERDGVGKGEWLALRAAARRHVASTGHATIVTVQDRYTYALVGPRSPQGAHL